MIPELVILFMVLILGYTFLIPTTEFEITTGNKTEIARSSQIGVVTGIEFLEDNKTAIEYTHGTWGIGWDKYDRIEVMTNQSLLPDDIIKVSSIRMEGNDCSFYNSDLNRSKSLFDFKIRTWGDKCGTYYEYKVEKIE